ncbi:hypothetical protein PCANC_28828 [Puccinia coronata f. sp. avenae]|nr:hypothetical protein PCANC_28828 [Puccinia coronata f. sp. avenae]
MAITLANDVAEVVALERSCAKGITARVKQKIINAPQRGINRAPRAPIQPPPKLSEGSTKLLPPPNPTLADTSHTTRCLKG